MSAEKRETLLYRAGPLQNGYNPIVDSGNSDLRLLEFGRIRLEKTQEFRTSTEEREACLAFLSGTGEVDINGANFESAAYGAIGDRKSVFHGNPCMVYAPRKAELHVKAVSKELHAALLTAPARRDTRPFVVMGDQLERLSFGTSNWRREACIALGDEKDVDRLLVGETYNMPGSWSSYPPHKHDESKEPNEEPYEEIYFFMMDPEDGFGMQRIYTARGAAHPIDEALVVQNGDTVVIPRGYHPVVAGAGYRLYYLWALAGEERRFGSWSDDPRHTWIRTLE